VKAPIELRHCVVGATGGSVGAAAIRLEFSLGSYAAFLQLCFLSVSTLIFPPHILLNGG